MPGLWRLRDALDDRATHLALDRSWHPVNSRLVLTVRGLACIEAALGPATGGGS